jgi:tRNA nucleotidyltransferase (CCA-adding enzyme)
MADYIYLLDNRLSPAQRNALRTVREIARSKNLTVFLVGGAVRDLTSGSPVRDLDVVVQGNALKLKKDLEKAGAVVTGELDPAQSLFLSFPGSVRLEFGSTLAVTFPKPGKAVYKAASILDDLRRRDFTANAMALSLNEGSYGLLMDPLNGVADIENRELRLVSNYGFIEDPVRMVRAARLMARLGWALDEKTQQRYETGKQEGYIASISDFNRGYETEEIVHEEDPLRVLRRLESEGWMKDLAPFWTSAKVDVAGLEHLREVQTQLQMQGIQPDASAANFPLLTAKLSAKEVASLKSGFPRQGFVKDIDSLDSRVKELTNLLSGKAATLPSQTWRILTSAEPEAVLSVAYSSKNPGIQAKLKNFFTVWPLARQKMPYVLMQEMRIVPELPGYEDLLEKLFFELMDDKLQTPEEMKAFLEPYSPPAPPPTVTVRRPRAPKKDAKASKASLKKAAVAEAEAESDSDADGDEIANELGGVVIGALDELVSEDAAPVSRREEAESEDDEEAKLVPASAKRPTKPVAKTPAKSAAKPAEKPSAKAPAKPATKAAPKAEPKSTSKTTAKPSAKAAPARKAPAPAKSAPAKSVPAKTVPAKKTASKNATAAAAPTVRRAVAPAKAVKTSAKAAKKAVPPAKKAIGKKASKPAPPPAKKVAAKKIPSRKLPAKKTVAKKVVAKKTSPAKSPAKKTPPAKSASKKSAPAKKRR